MSASNRVLPIGILEKYKNKELKVSFTPGEYYLADYLNKNFPKNG